MAHTQCRLFDVEPQQHALECRIVEAVNQQRSPDGGVFWPQGEFAFGSQSVQLKCPVDASYKHPDLIVLSPDKRRIYVTLYRREIAVVDLIDPSGSSPRMAYRGCISSTFPGHEYHGCCLVNSTTLCLGNVRPRLSPTATQTSLDVVDLRTQQQLSYAVLGARIKTIVATRHHLVLGLDGKTTKTPLMFDSTIEVYARLPRNHQNTIGPTKSVLRFPHSQLDGMCTSTIDGLTYVFATLHDDAAQTGYIVVIALDEASGQMRLVRKHACASFPHGIDVYQNQLAYTSYTDSSVVIMDNVKALVSA